MLATPPNRRIHTDLVVIAAQVVWARHAVPVLRPAETVDYWVVQERSRPGFERHCADWVARHFAGFTGMMRVESSGGRIAAVHPRSPNQWRDLYGRKWRDSMIRLQHVGTWDLIDAERAEGYSVELHGPGGMMPAVPTPAVVDELSAIVGVCSVRCAAVSQDGRPVAVVNCFNLEVGQRVRARLARTMGLPTGRPQRGINPASWSANAASASL